jgi:hypothetical protein
MRGLQGRQAATVHLSMGADRPTDRGKTSLCLSIYKPVHQSLVVNPGLLLPAF